MSSQKLFILIHCRVLSKIFRENVWKEANTLVKVAFCSSGITFQGHNKILSEIMKICLFFLSQFQWVFLFFCERSSTGLSKLNFRCSVAFFEKNSRQRCCWYVFIFEVLQKFLGHWSKNIPTSMSGFLSTCLATTFEERRYHIKELGV